MFEYGVFPGPYFPVFERFSHCIKRLKKTQKFVKPTGKHLCQIIFLNKVARSKQLWVFL